MEKISSPENTPAVLKSATATDIPVLIELEKSVAGPKTYSPMLETGEWEQAFKEGPVFLIMINGEIAGNFSYERKGKDRVYISGLVVVPEFQGRGISRAVLTKFLEEMKDTKRIDLVTHPDNPALKLYQSLGFVIESRKENYYGDGEPRLVLALKR